MVVREPIWLRLVREFPEMSLKLPSQKDTSLFVFRQSVQPDGGLLFADSDNHRVKILSLQTGALCVVFKEVDPGWLLSNLHIISKKHADVLVVTKGKGRDRRVVIARKNVRGIYMSEQAFLLDENSSV